MKLIMRNIKYIVSTIILIIFILNIKIVLLSTKDASIIFFNKIFISIFPFIILSDILIYFDYHIFLKKLFGKFISKIFNVDENSTIIFILSILTSTPCNAIYIKDMLDNNEIDISTANKIINYTFFPSLSFVIGTVGLSIYNSFKIGLILWLLIFIYNILIGLFLRKENNNFINKTIIKKKETFFNMLKDSFIKGLNTSFIILGNLIIFTIVINLSNKYLNMNDILFAFISGLLEITSGIMNISNLNIDLSYKLIFTFLIISFSSISVLFQAKSVLYEYNINIKRTLIIKLVFSLLILLLTIISTIYICSNVTLLTCISTITTC
jgi:hypothetical protein